VTPGDVDREEALLRWYYEAFPDVHYHVEQMLEAEGCVVTRARVTGPHRSKFMGPPAARMKEIPAFVWGW
jgi:predicted ester cyclase